MLGVRTARALHCHYGRKCKFDHIAGQMVQPHLRDPQGVSTGRGIQLASGRQFQATRQYMHQPNSGRSRSTSLQPYPQSNPRGIHLASGRYINPRRAYRPREVQLHQAERRSNRAYIHQHVPEDHVQAFSSQELQRGHIGGAGEVAMEDYKDTIFEGYDDDLNPPRYQ